MKQKYNITKLIEGDFTAEFIANYVKSIALFDSVEIIEDKNKIYIELECNPMYKPDKVSMVDDLISTVKELKDIKPSLYTQIIKTFE